METTERNYNEVYIYVATNVNAKERKRFKSLKDLEAYLYDKGYHLVMTDRATIFARYIMEGVSPLTIIDLTTRRDGSPKEICFAREKMYTGWVIGKNLCNKREVVVRCNCPGAYTNVTGHKTVTVPVDKITLLSDY